VHRRGTEKCRERRKGCSISTSTLIVTMTAFSVLQVPEKPDLSEKE
jgi:hypothetical protein